MNDADEIIERIMSGLRDAEPAHDFDQRILASLRSAARSKPVLSSRWFWPAWPSPSITFLWAGIVALTVGAAFLILGHRVLYDPPKATGSQRAAHLQPPEPPQSNRSHVQMPRPVISGRGKRTSVAKRGLPSETNALTNSPAPPLPLTQQERLLQRIASRRNPGNLALLNHDVQNSQNAQATEQFQHFFDMTSQEMRTQLE